MPFYSSNYLTYPLPEPFKEQLNQYYEYERGEEQKIANRVQKMLKEKEIGLYL